MQSAQTELIGFSLLRLGAASACSGPDGGTRTDWMINGMIKSALDPASDGTTSAPAPRSGRAIAHDR